MLKFKREEIFDLTVFTFSTPGITTYQLIFDPNTKEGFITLNLVDLLAKNRHTWNPDVRITICRIIEQYIINNECSVFFDFKLSTKNDKNRIYKFIRWISLFPNFKFKTKLLQLNNGVYVEFFIEKRN
jgi:hypothetical protein